MKYAFFTFFLIFFGVVNLNAQNHEAWLDNSSTVETTSTLESYHSEGTALFPTIRLNYSSDNTSQSGGSQNRMGTVFRDYSIINDGLFKITYSEDGSNVSNLLSMSTGQSTFKTPLKVEGSSLLEGLAWFKDDALIETGNLAIGVGIGSLNSITERIYLKGNMAVEGSNYIEFGKGLEKDEFSGRIVYNGETNLLEVYGGGFEPDERRINLKDKVVIGDRINNGLHADASLMVKGKVLSDAVIVTVDDWVIPDYVFEKDYDLMPLESLNNYITTNHHLPKIPSAKNIAKTGMNVGEMNILLLEKIEELTLHIIRINEELNQLKASK